MIKIICVGKIKEKYFKDAIAEYLKRLSKYTKINIIEVDDDSSNDENLILCNERNRIIPHIQKKDYIITLEIEGEEFDSLSLAKKIESILTLGYGNITFIIGGSHGLHEEIKEKANLHLSFSKLTFPHQMFRILLLEQIYRSFKINNNEAYHK